MGTSLLMQLQNLSNLLAPASGVTHGCLFRVTLNNNSARVFLESFAQEGLADFTPQALMIDNQASAQPVTVTEQWTNWTRVIQAGECRTLQYPAVTLPRFTLTSPGSAQVNFWLFDWPAFPDSNLNPATTTGAVVQIAGQPINVDIVAPMPAPYASAASVGNSHSIVLGGTAQNALNAGAATAGGFITNPSTAAAQGIGAAEPLFVDEANAAGTAEATGGTTVILQPGDTYVVPPTVSAVSVNAATTGHNFIAVRRL